MNRLNLILMIVVPMLRTAAIILRMRDADSVGADDDAAKAIDIAVNALEEWISSQPLEDAKLALKEKR